MEIKVIKKETCRHMRFRIPQDLADELWAVDPERCEICDPLMVRRGFSLDKSRTFQSKQALPFFDNN